MSKCDLKFDQPKNAGDVDNVIKIAIDSASGSKTAIQRACVAILYHIQKHGDYSKANDLVDGMPDSVNSASLVKWFRTYAYLKSGKVEGSTLKAFKGFTIDNKNVKQEEAAKAIQKTFSKACKHWWSDMLERRDPHDVFSADDAFRKFANALSRRQHKKEKNPELDYSFAVKDETLQVFLRAIPFDFIDRITHLPAKEAEEETAEAEAGTPAHARKPNTTVARASAN